MHRERRLAERESWAGLWDCFLAGRLVWRAIRESLDLGRVSSCPRPKRKDAYRPHICRCTPLTHAESTKAALPGPLISVSAVEEASEFQARTWIRGLALRFLRSIISRIGEDDNANHAVRLGILHFDATERTAVFGERYLAFQVYTSALQSCKVVLMRTSNSGQSSAFRETNQMPRRFVYSPNVNILRLYVPACRIAMKSRDTSRILSRLVFRNLILPQLRLIL